MADVTSSPMAQTTLPRPMHALHQQRALRGRGQALAFIVLAAGLVAALALSITLGSVRIPLDAMVTILMGGEVQTATWATIVLKFRLPKALTAALAGGALSVAGLQMQTLFRNPLAGPSVLGINAGASLGVALVVLGAGGTGATLLAGLGLGGEFGLALAASAGAAAVMVVILLAAQRLHNTMTILILGLMFGYAANALVTVLLYFAVADRIQGYLTWTFGSFGGVTWSQMRVLGPAVVGGLIVAHGCAKPLNALLLGDGYAASLGVSVVRVRLALVLSAALLAGAVTAFCGPIAFLGVAVPHLCRGLFNTADHRVLLPGVMLMGAILALIADLIAHLPGTQATLPLNAVTALIGAPVVAWVIVRRRHRRQAL